jgi:hypothetical protein
MLSLSLFVSFYLLGNGSITSIIAMLFLSLSLFVYFHLLGNQIKKKKKKTKRERERNNMSIIHVIDPLQSKKKDTAREREHGYYIRSVTK